MCQQLPTSTLGKPSTLNLLGLFWDFSSGNVKPITYLKSWQPRSGQLRWKRRALWSWLAGCPIETWPRGPCRWAAARTHGRCSSTTPQCLDACGLCSSPGNPDKVGGIKNIMNFAARPRSSKNSNLFADVRRPYLDLIFNFPSKVLDDEGGLHDRCGDKVFVSLVLLLEFG